MLPIKPLKEEAQPLQKKITWWHVGLLWTARDACMCEEVLNSLCRKCPALNLAIMGLQS